MRYLMILSLLTVLAAGLCGAENLSWQEDFNTIDAKRWKEIPASAEIVPTDQLSAANRALKLNPSVGQHYLTTADKFLAGDCEIRFSAAPPGDGDLFYYLGFHAYEPWLKSLCWILIHNETVTFFVKTPDGAIASERLAELTPGWHTLNIRQEESGIAVDWDGRRVLNFDDPALVSSEPMPFFIGANTSEGASAAADLRVDYLKVSGGKPRALMSERPATETERPIIADHPLVSAGGYAVALDGGMHWHSITADGVAMLNEAFFSPVFAVRLGNDIVYSHDFEVTGVSVSPDRFRVESFHPSSQVAATLTGEAGGGDFRMRLELANRGGQVRKIQPVFPIVGSLAIDGDLAATAYFFPWRGGVMGDNTAHFAAEYGGFSWMQLIFAWHPELERGLLLYPEDASGRFKGMAMTKQEKDVNPAVYFTEQVIPDEIPTLDLMENRSGLVIDYYYRGEAVPPGGSVSTPETLFAAWQGDWKIPMRRYADWMNARMQPVEAPRHFRDSFTWCNWHPPAYFDKESGRYIGSERIAGGEDAFQWAFWDDYVEYPPEAQVPVLQRYQPGDFEVNRSRGGVKAFAEEIRRIQDKGSRFSIYIDHRFCWRETRTARQHADEWAVKDPAGVPYGYTSPEDLYMMCFYDPDKWVEYMAETCQRLIRDTGMDAIYLDELGVAFPCYNERHDHVRDGDYPVDPVRLGRAMTIVRDRMKEANPEAALMTEHAGSDYLTQFYDGSWDQTFYMHAFPFTEQYYDQFKLCYFRFLFPHFKLSEWGESRDHIRRSFFNGMGWDMGSADTDLSRTLARVLKENGDAVATLTPEPIVPTTDPGLLANRFDAPGKLLYTYYNTSDAVLTAGVTESAPFTGHYVELRRDEMLDSPAVRLEPGEVAAVALLPELLTAAQTDAGYTFAAPPCAGQELLICEGVDDSHFLPPRGTWTRIDFESGQAAYAPRDAAAKLIVKLLRDDYLADEFVVPGTAR